MITDQREALGHRHPEPEVLWAYAAGPRVWERRPTDGDFGVVRVGVGDQSLATPLVAPVIDPTMDLEPVTAGALRRFLDRYSVVPDLPISIALRAFSRVSVVDSGDTSGARGLARAVLAQLATFHAPDDLVVAALVAPERRREWDWLKWLPHALHPTRVDALGPRRLVATSVAELDELLEELVAKRPRFQAWTPGPMARGADTVASPHVVVLVDGVEARASAHLGVEAGLAGVTVLEVAPAVARLERSTIRLGIDGDGAFVAPQWTSRSTSVRPTGSASSRPRVWPDG